jgi:ABC-type microcin C transport system permease subunit YejE
MCQNRLTILKATKSIVASNASYVHFPRCVKLATLFIIASFSICVGTIGGMFSSLVDYWSYTLLHVLQGTMDIMVLILCLLVLASNKLGGSNLVL